MSFYVNPNDPSNIRRRLRGSLANPNLSPTKRASLEAAAEATAILATPPVSTLLIDDIEDARTYVAEHFGAIETYRE